MAILSPTLRQRFFTSAGLPLVGGKLYTYAAGTTTPLASYTDATETVANANPVILDANGECDLWLGSNAYKVALYDSTDVLQWTVDNVNQASENSSASPDLLENFGISCAINSNVLTVNLTNASGGTPSALSPVAVGFRSSSLTSGVTSVLSVVSSLGMTVSSGSTLGHANNVLDYIYVYLINYNGTAEVAVSSTLYPETALYSTTAEGGTGTADSRSVIYSITARTNVPLRIIGRLTVTQTTAGAWAALPSQIQVGAIDQIYTIGAISAIPEKETFSVWCSSAQSILAAANDTIICNVERYDASNLYNTATGEFTLPRNGKALINAKMHVNMSPAGVYFSQLGVFKNGTAYKVSGVYFNNSGTTDYTTPHLNCEIEGLTTDVWTIKYTNSAYGVTIYNGIAYNWIDFLMIS